MDSSLVAWITGIGAVLSAAAGVALIVREFRNKQSKEIKRLDDQLSDTRDQLVEYHLYVHRLRETMADQGIDSPAPPRVMESE